MPSVRIITTGGTIDSSPEYDPNKKSVFDRSYLPDALSQARIETAVAIEPLMQKDSGDITDADRQRIAERCVAAPEDKILITHGTDTIAETARFLGERDFLGKAIVLVGSFVPLSQPSSDAHFNLGYALAAAHLLQSGVWVAVNGELFPWDNVRKNREKGRIERVR